jgi:glutathione S-transferase
MRLIGMMDSPYVRRVAISLKFMGLEFTSEQVSVFRHYDTFAQINPVVKAPTLVTREGLVLMDSTLILDTLERLAPPERRLTPAALPDYVRSQRILGLALAACEKAVQLHYERTLRPIEKQHQPWLDRVSGQLSAAYRLLEAEVAPAAPWLFGKQPRQADISIAVIWSFTGSVVSDVVRPADYPALTQFTQRAESLPEFISTPAD